MSDLDLILDEVLAPPPARGRKASAVKSRDLTPADIAKLHTLKEGDLSQETRPVLKIRETHHALARLIAEGRRNEEISQITGYDPGYISTIKNDPAFSNLVSYYSEQVEQTFVSVHERMASISMVAAEELQDRLVTEPEKLKTRELMELLALVADRTGFGPKTTNVNVNVDLAGRLERARARISTAVDVTPTRDPA